MLLTMMPLCLLIGTALSSWALYRSNSRILVVGLAYLLTGGGLYCVLLVRDLFGNGRGAGDKDRGGRSDGEDGRNGAAMALVLVLLGVLVVLVISAQMSMAANMRLARHRQESAGLRIAAADAISALLSGSARNLGAMSETDESSGAIRVVLPGGTTVVLAVSDETATAGAALSMLAGLSEGARLYLVKADASSGRGIAEEVLCLAKADGRGGRTEIMGWHEGGRLAGIPQAVE